MGMGLPFAVGAKAAKPAAQVICLHGDGSFGQNAMELDTTVRHKLPLLCVSSLNGGWTADPEHNKPGRDLGYTRYDKMAEALGCYAEYVEEPEQIGPALDRAWKKVEEGDIFGDGVNVADIDANAELDTAVRRQRGVTFGQSHLNFGRASERVDNADKLAEQSVAGALDDAAVVKGDLRIDQFGAERLEPAERTFLVGFD